MVFDPRSIEEMSRALSTHTWLYYSHFQSIFPFDRMHYEASGGKVIDELCDCDINLDTARPTDLLDNPAPEDKCMFEKLLTLSL
jgi:hypothetical protein